MYRKVRYGVVGLGVDYIHQRCDFGERDRQGLHERVYGLRVILSERQAHHLLAGRGESNHQRAQQTRVLTQVVE